MRIDPGRLGGMLVRAAGPIAVAVAAQSAGNLVFHALVGRLLDPDSYGALGAVLAAMVMLGIPLGALQTAASQHVATAGTGRSTTSRSLRSVARWTLLPALLTLACAPLLTGYFHLSGLADSLQLAPYLLVAALLATARGLLLGAARIGTVAVTYLVSTAVRLVLGVALVLPLGVAGALAATLLGELAALAVAVRPLLRAGGDDRGAPLRPGAVWGAGVAVTGLFLFSTVDLLLARHHLAGAASGSYVAAATVAKTVLALPAGIMSAVFPRLADGWTRPGRGGVLTAAMAAVALPALLGAAAVVAMPGLILTVLYGDGYGEDAGLVRALAAVAGLTSLVTVLTNAALARRSRTTLIPWAGAALEVVLIEIWHGSAVQIAACSAAALAPTLLAVLLGEGRAWWRAPSGKNRPAEADSAPAPAVR